MPGAGPGIPPGPRSGRGGRGAGWGGPGADGSPGPCWTHGRSTTLSVAAVSLGTGPATTHSGLIALVGLIVIGVLVLIVAGLTLYWLARQQTNYTWFMLHLAIGMLGILAVMILAVEGVLDAAAAAILSSIVAYSLGASGSRSTGVGDAGPPPSPPLALVPLPQGQVNVPYRADTVHLAGRAQPYGLAWMPVNGSSLPPGLQFDGGSGVVSGTPTQAGTFRFSVSAHGDGMVGSFELTVVAGAG